MHRESDFASPDGLPWAGWYFGRSFQTVLRDGASIPRQIEAPVEFSFRSITFRPLKPKVDDMEYYPRDAPGACRNRPMEVLVLGLPRTGTTSICAALRKLGVRPYHFNEISKNKDNKHFQQWLQAVSAKYDGLGKQWSGSRDFDRLLWNYTAVTDDPCCLFVDELIAAYPNAKLILTTRSSADTWYSSMKNFIIQILAWKKSYFILSLFDREFTASYMALLNRTTRVLSGGMDPTKDAASVAMKEYYNDHIRHVQLIAAREGKPLLMLESSMGWKPLCEFLEKPVPAGDIAYPHLNSTQEALELEWTLYWERWSAVANTASMRALLAILVGMLVLGLTKITASILPLATFGQPKLG